MIFGSAASMQIVRPLPLCASRSDVQREADKIRKSLGYEPGDDVSAVVARLGGRIVVRSFWETMTSEDGSIVIRGPKDFDIYLSDATSPRRDRFTIAHELGHYFLHFARQRTSMPPGSVMVAQRSATGREETEAHWFAAEFLMPAQEFKRAWLAYDRSVSTLAHHFEVSTHAVEVRVSSLGL
jgi:Zn-dependent peptidase ImmA (M78 family)